MRSNLFQNEVSSRTGKTTEQLEVSSAEPVADRLKSDMYRTSHFFKIFKNPKEKIDHWISGSGVDKMNMTAMKIAAIKNRMNLSHGLQDVNKHDGNICADDEELLGDLCYKKCSKFHGGKY